MAESQKQDAGSSKQEYEDKNSVRITMTLVSRMLVKRVKAYQMHVEKCYSS